MEDRLKYHRDSQVSLPGVASFQYQRFTVDNGIDTGRSVKFDVPAQPDCYIDLSECYLKTVFSIINADGSNIPSSPDVFPKESFGNLLWSQVAVSLNNTPLPVTNDHPFTAQLIDILGSSPNFRLNVDDPLAGFSIPSYGSSLIKNARPSSYRENKRLCRDSRDVEVYSRIHSDFLMTCSQYLPNNMNLRVTLDRTKDDFVLGSDKKIKDKTGAETSVMPGSYKIDIKECSLYIKRICLNHEAGSIMGRELANGGELLYQRLETVVLPCAQGMQTWNWRNCFNNIAPRRVFVALVTQDAFFGKYDRTPLYLESANVTSVRFSLSGRDIMAEPYRTRFGYDKDEKVDKIETEARGAFAGLCRTIGSFSAVRQSRGISYNDFIDGATIFAVSLDHAESTAASSGSFDLSISFANGCDQPYMVIVMGEYPKTISFDANRNITFPQSD